MNYIKNKTATPLELNGFGVTLAVGELRDVSEFATRDMMERYASILVEYVNNGEIIFTDADQVEFSTIESIQFISNGYNKVLIVNNVTDPLKVDAVDDMNRFYFLKNGNLTLSKGVVYTKTFLGDINTLSVFAKHANITIVIKMNGLVFPAQEIQKNQSFEFDFDEKAFDFSIDISTDKNAKNIELYMDGKSNAPLTEIQTFIDNWSL